MDLVRRKPLETVCHTLHLNKPFKSYINKTLWRPSLIFAFFALLAKYLQGCPPRLCSCVYVEMISTGQPFTARHVPHDTAAYVRQSVS